MTYIYKIPIGKYNTPIIAFSLFCILFSFVFYAITSRVHWPESVKSYVQIGLTVFFTLGSLGIVQSFLNYVLKLSLRVEIEFGVMKYSVPYIYWYRVVTIDLKRQKEFGYKIVRHGKAEAFHYFIDTSNKESRIMFIMNLPILDISKEIVKNNPGITLRGLD